MRNIRNKINKKYSQLRNSYIKSEEKPKRLIIEKAKWCNNADSPVMLMIDDLANAWHSKNGNSTWDIGGDWGGGLSGKCSIISFLNKNLLNKYTEIKVTFFAVAGKTSQYTYNEPFSFSEPLNFNGESKKHFRELNDNDRFEIAYHGYNHGTPGKEIKDFVQEWKGFQSIDDAVKQTEMGKDIFKDVFDEYPKGGKYGGWEYNGFADDSIDRAGFIWWSRDWMPRDTQDQICDSYYEPQFFGQNFVVALPSTIHGFQWSKKQIDLLLSKQQVISIEEHIAPLRPDGLVQTPNIVDDIDELNHLFNYLKDKNVWYATGSEITEYFIGFSFTTICDIKHDSFKIRYTGKLLEPPLTLQFDFRYLSEEKDVKIITPDNQTIKCLKDSDDGLYKVNINVKEGSYNVIVQ